MDIDGVFYCSRCMRKLDQEEQICPHCGYDAASAQVSSQHLEEGTFLNDRYLLGAVIGAGGFGVTYAAWDENLSVPVAIKEYFPVKYAHRNVAESDEILPHEEGRAPFALGLSRFRREAQVLAQFQNVPGIVGINECFDENGTAYIAMEFVHGVPLDVYVRERKPTPRKLLEIMLPAINALETIHRQGVNHRDVKPENLLVQEDGSIKLIDFGSAREVEHVTNLVIVSDGYAALEQYDPRQPQGPFVDVYGVSATIYHMLTGVMPDAAISRAKHDKLKKPTRLGVRLKKYQEDALMAGLAVDPQKRIQSIAEFRSRLYNMPLPEEVRRRKAFVRRVMAVVALTMLLMAAAFVNFAIGFPLGEGLLYSLYPDGWHVVGVAEEQAEVTVPADRLGLPVTVIAPSVFRDSKTLMNIVIPGSIKEIAPFSFSNCSALLGVTLEEGVENIGDGAFAYCHALWSVQLPFGMTIIGDNAFSYCSSLWKINIPPTVVSINDETFAYCSSLSSLDLPSGTTKIGDRAFAYCAALSQIRIPNSVTTIGEHAFDTCHKLTYVRFDKSSSLNAIGASAFSECRSLKEIAIPEGVTSIGSHAFYCCSSLASITLPDGVNLLGSATFYQCDALTSITIPHGTTEVGDSMFKYCDALTHVQLPDSVVNIDSTAFQECISLTDITIPNGVTSIGSFAFSDCTSLANITIPDSVTSIEQYAFSDCSSLTSLTIPGSLTSIGERTFQNCENLISVSLPDSLIHIGNYAFWDCGYLEKINIPNGVTSIGDGAFGLCTSLGNITLPEGLTSIGEDSFEFCPITSITIPNNVTSIGKSAFAFCRSLTSITIPKSVISMGEDLFSQGNPDLVVQVEPDSYALQYCHQNNLNYTFAATPSGT